MGLGLCADCKEERKIHSKGRCSRCCKRAWDKAHPNYNKETLKRHYSRHKVRLRSLARLRYRTELIVRFSAQTTAVAKRRGRSGRISKDEISCLFPSLFDGVPAANCVFCGHVVIPGVNASLDHIEPDGEHSIGNVHISCVSCNASRQRSSVQDFKSRFSSDESLRLHIAEVNSHRICSYLIKVNSISLEELVEWINIRQAGANGVIVPLLPR
jgi:hypothetical protein